MPDLPQANVTEIQTTSDPDLGYEVRDAYLVQDTLVVVTAREDGFAEAISFDAKALPAGIGTAANPIHIYEVNKELRARWSAGRPQG